MQKLIIFVFALVVLAGTAFCDGSTSFTPIDADSGYNGELRQAQRLVDNGEFVEAAELYQQLAMRQSDPMRAAEFYLLEAQNLLAGKKSYRAKEAYTKLVDKFLFYIPLESVIEQIRELAENFEQGKGVFLGISDPAAAVQLYQLIVAMRPDIQLSMDDRMALAEKQQNISDWQGAVNTCQNAIKLAPRNPEPRLRLALLLDKLATKDGDGDGQRTRAALREGRSFLELSKADDPRRSEIQRIVDAGRSREAQRLLVRVQFYLNKHHRRPQVARRYLHDILRDYADTPEGATARQLLALHFPEETTTTDTDKKP